MNKLARQSILLILFLILICILGRVLNHSSYTVYIPIPDARLASDTFIIEDNDRGTGELIFEEPAEGPNYLRIKARPNDRGTIEAQIVNQKGEVVTELFYHVNRFGTIFDYSTGGFTGDSIVMICLTVFFLVESLLMFLAFRRAKGPDFYAYSTIHTSGFSLFLLLTGLLQLAATIRHIMDPMSFTMLGVYGLISSAGYNFMRITFPFILTFAIAMTVSNIALLRHERVRFQNVLGILISILMVGGVLLAFVVFNADFSGSEREYHIFLTVQNVYCTAYTYFECMLIGAIICGIKAANHEPAGIFDYIIILGCGFRKDGTLPPLLQGRVDRAIRFWKEQQEKYGNTATLIPSGGQGPNEVMAEAEAMHRYLTSKKIPEEYILPENQSRNTYQNMEFSKNLIEKSNPGARVVFSTTNYHVFRSGIWASLAGLRAEGIGSDTKWWFWPNAFMRECIGLLANRWKQEIVLLLVLVLVFGTMSAVL